MAFYQSLISTATLVVTALYSTITFGNNGSDHTKFYNLSLSDLGKVKITTATGNSTSLDRAPATASVITALQIEAMGAKNLDEVLETIPGLHVSVSALSRLDSIYFIRGIHSGFNPHVLLLKNGVPVQYSLQGSRPLLFRLPVRNISQIEVIRGPGSAIYGADAYSGVINIITKDHKKVEPFQVGGGSGSFHSRDFWLQGKTSVQNWNAVYNLSYQKSDGDPNRRVQSDLQTMLDSQLATNASLAPGMLSTQYEILDLELDITNKYWSINIWNWDSNNSGLGPGAAQALDPKGNDNSQLFQTNISYNSKKDIENWNHNARISYQRYKTQAQFNLLPPGTIIPIGNDGNLDFFTPVGLVEFTNGLIGNPGATTTDTQLDLTSIFTGVENHRFRLNIGSKHQKLDTYETKNFGPGVIDGTQPVISGLLTDVSNTSFVYAKDTSRSIQYISVQDEWRFSPDWELTAGLRYDKYSDFGSTTNPRIALVWATHQKLTSKILYGSAFRAPSFSERFFANNPISLGKQDLDPEVIDTIELSFNFNITENFQNSISLFSYKAKDMIEFVPDEGGTTSTAQNSRDQDGRGIEWDLNWIITKDVHLKSSYSHQAGKNKTTNSNIADAPRDLYTMSLNWQIDKNWSLNGIVNHVANRKRLPNDQRNNIHDYSIIDLHLKRKKVLPGLDISMSVKNSTNQNAKEPSRGSITNDYPLQSRSIWLDFSYLY